MSAVTPIQWTDRTWNPVRGCSRVSPGCDHCYAMGQAHRFSGTGKPYHELTTIRRGKVDWSGVARFVPSELEKPLRWRKPQRVFVNSMSDLFHHSLSNEEIAAVFGVMAAAPRHTFQVLTKRPERMLEWFNWIDNKPTGLLSIPRSARLNCTAETHHHLPEWHWTVHRPDEWPLPNVWLGVSIEDQKTADERIPLLLKTPAAVRFLSCEPLLESVDLRPYLFRGEHRVCPRCLFATNARVVDTACPNNDGGTLGPDIAIDWTIVGGESGPGARPCALEWIGSVVEQCRGADVPCFVKQLGAYVVSEERALDSDDDGKRDGLDSRWLWRASIKDRKGGDITAWPAELRVRQFPEVRA